MIRLLTTEGKGEKARKKRSAAVVGVGWGGVGVITKYVGQHAHVRPSGQWPSLLDDQDLSWATNQFPTKAERN